jgi:hypothetical protein
VWRYIPEDRTLHLVLVYKFIFTTCNIVTDLIYALPDNSSAKTAQHATIEEAVFSVDPTYAPIDWLDSDHVICLYFRFMSVPRQYNESCELKVQSELELEAQKGTSGQSVRI